MASSNPAVSARRRIWGAVIAAAVLIAAILAIKYGRHHVWPRRFAEVEPGKLYRSGYCEPGPLTDVIHEHKVKTILTLLGDEPDTAHQQNEEAIAKREGVAILRIPMPGDGRGDFEKLSAAADAMADASKQPMLVHCWSGVNRTGAAYVAYRLKHCGWPLERALAEAEANGYSPESTPQLREHLQRYAEYLASGAGSRPSTSTAAS
jgi:tyrosine-protein phosphatase SIW14